uniref:Uncharacterized protein n=1 Tax=Neospora caninum (strain Liverpool) TaxID=572307 RepID=A0A0F7UDL2_NEOCL|nr:TPA: hypothetical protein BN1204_037305 [Neospora caninum Liverpool]
MAFVGSRPACQSTPEREAKAASSKLKPAGRRAREPTGGPDLFSTAQLEFIESLSVLLLLSLPVDAPRSFAGLASAVAASPPARSAAWPCACRFPTSSSAFPCLPSAECCPEESAKRRDEAGVESGGNGGAVSKSRQRRRMLPSPLSNQERGTDDEERPTKAARGGDPRGERGEERGQEGGAPLPTSLHVHHPGPATSEAETWQLERMARAVDQESTDEWGEREAERGARMSEGANDGKRGNGDETETTARDCGRERSKQGASETGEPSRVRRDAADVRPRFEHFFLSPCEANTETRELTHSEHRPEGTGKGTTPVEQGEDQTSGGLQEREQLLNRRRGAQACSPSACIPTLLLDLYRGNPLWRVRRKAFPILNERLIRAAPFFAFLLLEAEVDSLRTSASCDVHCVAGPASPLPGTPRLPPDCASPPSSWGSPSLLAPSGGATGPAPPPERLEIALALASRLFLHISREVQTSALLVLLLPMSVSQLWRLLRHAVLSPLGGCVSCEIGSGSPPTASEAPHTNGATEASRLDKESRQAEAQWGTEEESVSSRQRKHSSARPLQANRGANASASASFFRRLFFRQDTGSKNAGTQTDSTANPGVAPPTCKRTALSLPQGSMDPSGTSVASQPVGAASRLPLASVGSLTAARAAVPYSPAGGVSLPSDSPPSSLARNPAFLRCWPQCRDVAAQAVSASSALLELLDKTHSLFVSSPSASPPSTLSSLSSTRSFSVSSSLSSSVSSSLAFSPSCATACSALASAASWESVLPASRLGAAAPELGEGREPSASRKRDETHVGRGCPDTERLRRQQEWQMRILLSHFSRALRRAFLLDKVDSCAMERNGKADAAADTVSAVGLERGARESQELGKDETKQGTTDATRRDEIRRGTDGLTGPQDQEKGEPPSSGEAIRFPKTADGDGVRETVHELQAGRSIANPTLEPLRDGHMQNGSDNVGEPADSPWASETPLDDTLDALPSLPCVTALAPQCLWWTVSQLSNAPLFRSSVHATLSTQGSASVPPPASACAPFPLPAALCGGPPASPGGARRLFACSRDSLEGPPSRPSHWARHHALGFDSPASSSGVAFESPPSSIPVPMPPPFLRECCDGVYQHTQHGATARIRGRTRARTRDRTKYKTRASTRERTRDRTRERVGERTTQRLDDRPRQRPGERMKAMGRGRCRDISPFPYVFREKPTSVPEPADTDGELRSSERAKAEQELEPRLPERRSTRLAWRPPRGNADAAAEGQGCAPRRHREGETAQGRTTMEAVGQDDEDETDAISGTRRWCGRPDMASDPDLSPLPRSLARLRRRQHNLLCFFQPPFASLSRPPVFSSSLLAPLCPPPSAAEEVSRVREHRSTPGGSNACEASTLSTANVRRLLMALSGACRLFVHHLEAIEEAARDGHQPKKAVDTQATAAREDAGGEGENAGHELKNEMGPRNLAGKETADSEDDSAATTSRVQLGNRMGKRDTRADHSLASSLSSASPFSSRSSSFASLCRTSVSPACCPVSSSSRSLSPSSEVSRRPAFSSFLSASCYSSPFRASSWRSSLVSTASRISSLLLLLDKQIAQICGRRGDACTRSAFQGDDERDPQGDQAAENEVHKSTVRHDAREANQSVGEDELMEILRLLIHTPVLPAGSVSSQYCHISQAKGDLLNQAFPGITGASPASHPSSPCDALASSPCDALASSPCRSRLPSSSASRIPSPERPGSLPSYPSLRACLCFGDAGSPSGTGSARPKRREHWTEHWDARATPDTKAREEGGAWSHRQAASPCACGVGFFWDWSPDEEVPVLVRRQARSRQPGSPPRQHSWFLSHAAASPCLGRSLPSTATERPPKDFSPSPAFPSPTTTPHEGARVGLASCRHPLEFVAHWIVLQASRVVRRISESSFVSSSSTSLPQASSPSPTVSALCSPSSPPPLSSDASRLHSPAPHPAVALSPSSASSSSLDSLFDMLLDAEAPIARLLPLVHALRIETRSPFPFASLLRRTLAGIRVFVPLRQPLPLPPSARLSASSLPSVCHPLSPSGRTGCLPALAPPSPPSVWSAGVPQPSPASPPESGKSLLFPFFFDDRTTPSPSSALPTHLHQASTSPSLGMTVTVLLPDLLSRFDVGRWRAGLDEGHADPSRLCEENRASGARDSRCEPESARHALEEQRQGRHTGARGGDSNHGSMPEPQPTDEPTTRRQDKEDDEHQRDAGDKPTDWKAHAKRGQEETRELLVYVAMRLLHETLRLAVLRAKQSQTRGAGRLWGRSEAASGASNAASPFALSSPCGDSLWHPERFRSPSTSATPPPSPAVHPIPLPASPKSSVTADPAAAPAARCRSLVASLLPSPAPASPLSTTHLLPGLVNETFLNIEETYRVSLRHFLALFPSRPPASSAVSSRPVRASAPQPAGRAAPAPVAWLHRSSSALLRSLLPLLLSHALPCSLFHPSFPPELLRFLLRFLGAPPETPSHIAARTACGEGTCSRSPLSTLCAQHSTATCGSEPAGSVSPSSPVSRSLHYLFSSPASRPSTRPTPPDDPLLGTLSRMHPPSPLSRSMAAFILSVFARETLTWILFQEEEQRDEASRAPRKQRIGDGAPRDAPRGTTERVFQLPGTVSPGHQEGVQKARMQHETGGKSPVAATLDDGQQPGCVGAMAERADAESEACERRSLQKVLFLVLLVLALRRLLSPELSRVPTNRTGKTAMAANTLHEHDSPPSSPHVEGACPPNASPSPSRVASDRASSPRAAAAFSPPLLEQRKRERGRKEASSRDVACRLLARFLATLVLARTSEAPDGDAVQTGFAREACTGFVAEMGAKSGHGTTPQTTRNHMRKDVTFANQLIYVCAVYGLSPLSPVDCMYTLALGLRQVLHPGLSRLSKSTGFRVSPACSFSSSERSYSSSSLLSLSPFSGSAAFHGGVSLASCQTPPASPAALRAAAGGCASSPETPEKALRRCEHLLSLGSLAIRQRHGRPENNGARGPEAATPSQAEPHGWPPDDEAHFESESLRSARLLRQPRARALIAEGAGETWTRCETGRGGGRGQVKRSVIQEVCMSLLRLLSRCHSQAPGGSRESSVAPAVPHIHAFLFSGFVAVLDTSRAPTKRTHASTLRAFSCSSRQKSDSTQCPSSVARRFRPGASLSASARRAASTPLTMRSLAGPRRRAGRFAWAKKPSQLNARRGKSNASGSGSSRRERRGSGTQCGSRPTLPRSVAPCPSSTSSVHGPPPAVPAATSSWCALLSPSSSPRGSPAHAAAAQPFSASPAGFSPCASPGFCAVCSPTEGGEDRTPAGAGRGVERAAVDSSARRGNATKKHAGSQAKGRKSGESQRGFKFSFTHPSSSSLFDLSPSASSRTSEESPAKPKIRARVAGAAEGAQPPQRAGAAPEAERERRETDARAKPGETRHGPLAGTVNREAEDAQGRARETWKEQIGFRRKEGKDQERQFCGGLEGHNRAAVRTENRNGIVRAQTQKGERQRDRREPNQGASSVAKTEDRGPHSGRAQSAEETPGQETTGEEPEAGRQEERGKQSSPDIATEAIRNLPTDISDTMKDRETVSGPSCWRECFPLAPCRKCAADPDGAFPLAGRTLALSPRSLSTPPLCSAFAPFCCVPPAAATDAMPCQSLRSASRLLGSPASSAVLEKDFDSVETGPRDPACRRQPQMVSEVYQQAPVPLKPSGTQGCFLDASRVSPASAASPVSSPLASPPPAPDSVAAKPRADSASFRSSCEARAGGWSAVSTQVPTRGLAPRRGCLSLSAEGDLGVFRDPSCRFHGSPSVCDHGPTAGPKPDESPHGGRDKTRCQERDEGCDADPREKEGEQPTEGEGSQGPDGVRDAGGEAADNETCAGLGHAERNGLVKDGGELGDTKPGVTRQGPEDENVGTGKVCGPNHDTEELAEDGEGQSRGARAERRARSEEREVRAIGQVDSKREGNPPNEKSGGTRVGEATETKGATGMTKEAENEGPRETRARPSAKTPHEQRKHGIVSLRQPVPVDARCTRKRHGTSADVEEAGEAVRRHQASITTEALLRAGADRRSLSSRSCEQERTQTEQSAAIAERSRKETGRGPGHRGRNAETAGANFGTWYALPTIAKRVADTHERCGERASPRYPDDTVREPAVPPTRDEEVPQMLACQVGSPTRSPRPQWLSMTGHASEEPVVTREETTIPEAPNTHSRFQIPRDTAVCRVKLRPSPCVDTSRKLSAGLACSRSEDGAQTSRFGAALESPVREQETRRRLVRSLPRNVLDRSNGLASVVARRGRTDDTAKRLAPPARPSGERNCRGDFFGHALPESEEGGTQSCLPSDASVASHVSPGEQTSARESRESAQIRNGSPRRGAKAKLKSETAQAQPCHASASAFFVGLQVRGEGDDGRVVNLPFKAPSRVREEQKRSGSGGSWLGSFENDTNAHWFRATAHERREVTPRQACGKNVLFRVEQTAAEGEGSGADRGLEKRQQKNRTDGDREEEPGRMQGKVQLSTWRERDSSRSDVAARTRNARDKVRKANAAGGTRQGENAAEKQAEKKEREPHKSRNGGEQSTHIGKRERTESAMMHLRSCEQKEQAKMSTLGSEDPQGNGGRSASRIQEGEASGRSPKEVKGDARDQRLPCISRLV